LDISVAARYYNDPAATAPQSRPVDQTVPGPRGRAPREWAEILRRRAD